MKMRLHLVGIVDGLDLAKHVQGEYKTGTKPWSLRKISKDVQLRCYALMHWIEFSTLPVQRLTWIETVREDGILRATGDSTTIEIAPSLQTVLEAAALCWKCAREISTMYSDKLAIL
jgi:hypothetical protein